MATQYSQSDIQYNETLKEFSGGTVGDYWWGSPDNANLSDTTVSRGSGLVFSGSNPVNIAIPTHGLTASKHVVKVSNSSVSGALANDDYIVNTVVDANNITVPFTGTGASGICNVDVYTWYTLEALGTARTAIHGTTDDIKLSDTASSKNLTITANDEIGSINTKDGTNTYSGTLTDGGFNVDVNGDIIISSDTTLTSTGHWHQKETGNIDNTYTNNPFAILEVSDASKTTTLIGVNCYCGKMIINSGTCNNGRFWVKNPAANDFIIVDSSATITSDILTQLSVDRTQGTLNCTGFTGKFNFYGNNKFTITGNWVFANAGGVGLSSGTVDFNSFDVNIGGIFYCGYAAAFFNFYMGEGTITLGGIERQAGSTGTINIYGESATININGSVDLTTMTWNRSTETVNFNSTSGTLTLTMNSQRFHTVEIDNNGTTSLTLQDTLNCDSFETKANSVFTDNAQTCNVYGNLLIDDTASGFNSTGHWYQLETGNIKNINIVNLFGSITLGDTGKTNTLVGAIRTKKLTIGSGTVNGHTIYISSFANDYLIINSSATITSGIYLEGSHDNGALSCVGFTGYLRLSINNGGMSGNWYFPNCNFSFQIDIFNCNGYTLTIDNGFEMGVGGSNATLNLGTGGKIVCTGFSKRTGATATLIVNGASGAAIESSGSVDLTGITWNKNGETLKINAASGDQNLTFNSEVVNDLEINKAADKAICQDAIAADKLIQIAGELQLRSGIVSTFTDFEGSGGLINSVSAGSEATMSLTNSATVSGITFQDIYMNAANKVNAKDSCTNNGNIKGMVFNDVLRTF